ncbi:hypothetical protein BDZ88DRAFT_477910 [Geranomyces variabilis]|nr:hypothetical protein BDZ88DRAFT_477910 [Geranomyces variabilis]
MSRSCRGAALLPYPPQGRSATTPASACAHPRGWETASPLTPRQLSGQPFERRNNHDLKTDAGTGPVGWVDAQRRQTWVTTTTWTPMRNNAEGVMGNYVAALPPTDQLRTRLPRQGDRCKSDRVTRPRSFETTRKGAQAQRVARRKQGLAILGIATLTWASFFSKPIVTKTLAREEGGQKRREPKPRARAKSVLPLPFAYAEARTRLRLEGPAKLNSANKILPLGERLCGGGVKTRQRLEDPGLGRSGPDVQLQVGIRTTGGGATRPTKGNRRKVADAHLNMTELHRTVVQLAIPEKHPREEPIEALTPMKASKRPR